jgi:plasmid stabilization system protein ParE
MVANRAERIVKEHQLTKRAINDLREIWDYIEADGGTAIAAKVAAELNGAFAQLAARPEMGHARPDARNQRFRFWRVNRFMIAYFPDTEPLQIVRIAGARRDFRKLF